MLMAIGTSTCHMLLSGEKHPMPGICGVVGDSVLPRLYTYEAGQACVGDLLDWFVKEAVPARETEAAQATGESIHAYLCREAVQLPPGSGGLMALDWWNGQRSPYVDDRLSGMMLGLTIRTTPAQQYRALMGGDRIRFPPDPGHLRSGGRAGAADRGLRAASPIKTR